MAERIHLPTFSDAELAEFWECGYVRLGRVVPTAQIEALCDRIDDIMLGRIHYDNMLMQLCPSAGDPELSRQTKTFKGSSLKYRKIQDLEQDPLFRAYMQHPLFRDITRKILGEEVSLMRAMFFNKPAGAGVPIGWHQDGAGGWGLSIPPKVTIWTALDPTSIANGCLQIIPGSHRTKIPAQGDLLNPEECALHAPDEKRRYLEMKRGEVVLLHNWTLHHSGVNQTDDPRRAFSVCYLEAATRHAATGAPFPLIFPEYVPVERLAAVAASPSY
jgi:phytanoyl-CoA dioxygenase PhyH